MKRNPLNPGLGVKTGKDLLNLLSSKDDKTRGLTHIKPTNDIERRLFTMWTELLGHENFGLEDDYFAAGGNSLKGVQLLSRISREFQASLTLTDIFLHNTIKKLSAAIVEQQKAESGFKIQEQKRPERIPLSFNQERLWFIDQFDGSLAYHISTVLRLQGRLNTKAINFAFTEIINRHEILRTVIRKEEGLGYQVIQGINNWNLTEIDRRGFSDDDGPMIRQLIDTPFNLSEDNMMRVVLIRVDENEHILVLVLHHIAADGWSGSIIIREFIQLYAAFENNQLPALAPLSIQYADFAIWQRTAAQQLVINKQLGYWKEKLAGATMLQLPADYPRPAMPTFEGAVEKFLVDKELSDKLQFLGQQQSSTLFMVLLTAFKALLFRYSSQSDIIVGTAIAGRRHVELENLIGFFVNTLALRTHMAKDQAFVEVLNAVKNTTLEALENQEVPFEKVVETVSTERSTNRNPLFQVMFVFQNTPDKLHIDLGEIKLTEERYDSNKAKFELDLSITETSNGLEGNLEYSKDVYQEGTIKRMIAHFKLLLESIVIDPNQKIGLLPILSAAEQHQLLKEFNHTGVDYPKSKSIVHLFEERVAATPGNIALVFENRRFTYQELNDRANQLANYLKRRGVNAESLVPLCIERSAEMIIAVMGILKASGAYIPIDPDYPSERIEYILEDTRARLILSTTTAQKQLPAATDREIILIDSDWPAIEKESVKNLPGTPSPQQLAYVIYTSGSTGRPKGVMIEHNALVDHCYGVIKSAGLNSCVSFALFAPLVFDAGHSIIFSSFLQNAALHVLSDDLLANGDRLAEYLDVNQVDCIKIVPSLWLSYADENNYVLGKKVIIFGGDNFSVNVLSHLRKIEYAGTVYNHYGPTEATIGKTIHRVNIHNPYTIVPIGRPFSNSEIYIIDDSGQLAPIGIAGELCISGEGLARAYLNQPELTAKKFVANPFNEARFPKMYRTGDQSRWLPDGNIEYLGRIDEQIKLRGFRIEPGEIESLLQEFDAISQVIVMVKEDHAKNKRLVAYVVPLPGFLKKDAQLYLKGRLPEYMIPTIWVELDEMPLTTNGKIDRKALPDPDISVLQGREYVPPQNQIERVLVDIWEQLLAIKAVSIHDNFFEVGGHSLLAMRVVAAIAHKLQIQLSIRMIFEYQTISTLAAYITKLKAGNADIAIRSVPRPSRLPLSFSQERLWFIDQLQGSIQYHISGLLSVKGNLNKEALSNAFLSVISRHEALRAVFFEDNGEAIQEIRDAADWRLEEIDNYSQVPSSEGLQKLIENTIMRPFELSKDYKLRVLLIHKGKQDYLLVLTMHHIASDGWSLPILVREVVEFYSAFSEDRAPKVVPLKLQYPDYAVWQRSFLSGQVLEQKLNYWRAKLKGITPLQLPTDFIRPASLSANGGAVDFLVEKELTLQLQALGRQQDCTVFMVLFAAYNVLLHRYSNQEDICVGIPVANRPHKELEDLIGFFVNSLALRTQIDSDIVFTDLLKQVKENMLEAFEHQDTPFEKVVEAVVQDRDLSRAPLFQVMFVLQNNPELPPLVLSNVTLTKEPVQYNASKFEIIFSLEETPGGLKGRIEYSTDLYNETTISRMAGHFKTLLGSITNTPSRKIRMLSLLTKEEEGILLNGLTSTANYPFEKTIVDLFEEQVRTKPENIAVCFGNVQLTYSQLNEKSNQLAHLLREKGIREDSLVPICTTRSIEMIIGLLGILKAGGAYVPIDPEYPTDRINFILSDTASTLVVCNDEAKSSIVFAGIETLSIDGNSEQISRQPIGNVPTELASHHLAYVIYTSGSTGKPKGVLIEHRNVVSLFFTNPPLYDFNETDVWAMFHSFCFDFSVWEMYGAFFFGGRLVMVPRHATSDITRFVDLVLTEKVTVLNQTPSAFYALQDCITEKKKTVSIRYVIFGGEALNPAKLQPWKQLYPHTRLVNMYGITETTVHVTYQEIEWHHILEGKSVIGRSIPSLKTLILDSNQNLLPIGIPGELCIGGAGLARGYLNRPDLTSQRFINDPFVKESGARLYRSGDLAVRLENGNLEYIGRIDEQVKIRGYRIELGEIEIVLNECPLVRQAVALSRENHDGSKLLVGYIIPENKFDREAVIAFVKKRLPEYMVPALWVEMEQFPLTSNGKINKKALPSPDAGRLTRKEFVPPVTQVEISIASIFKELLGVDRVGMNDNFFELGGDSIKVIKVVSKFRAVFNKEIKVFDIYHAATIAELATSVTNSPELSGHDTINYRQGAEDISRLKDTLLPVLSTDGLVEDVYPMSDIQAGMVYASLLDPELAIYHDQFAYTLSKNLDTEVFEKALRLLVEKHGILRTAFNLDIHTEGIQIVYKSVPLHVTYINKEEVDKSQEKEVIRQYFKEERSKPFDVNKAPLFRYAIIKFSDRNVFCFQFHHAIMDGWSLANYNTELNNLYLKLLDGHELEKLTPLKASYKDYIIAGVVDKKNEANKIFWKNELMDYKRLEIFSKDATSQKLNRRYQTEFFDALEKKVKQDGFTLKGIFFAAYLYSLSLLTPEEELTVGLVSNNRPLVEDGDRILGCFLNTIPCRVSNPNTRETWKDYFRSVEDKLIELKERDRLPLLEISSVSGEKNTSENPFFDALFSFVNFHVYHQFEEGLANPFETSAEKFEFEDDSEDIVTNTYLNFIVQVRPNSFQVHYRLRKKLKSGKSLVQLNHYFDKVLENYLYNDDRKITRASILDQQEQQLLLNIPPTALSYPKEETVVSLFEMQVEKYPDSIALVFDGKSLTYRGLSARANQLANYLRKRGIKEESVVAVCMERGLNMMIAIIGILKAGAAYVPIDPEFPSDRIEYMLEDTNSSVLLTDEETGSIVGHHANVEVIEIDSLDIRLQSEQKPGTDLQASNAAYIIYTSGSTGRPKGVVIEHGNLLDYVFGLDNKIQINECKTFALVSTIATDLGNTVIYSALVSGGALHILSKEATTVVEMIHAYFAEHNIECLKIVPSHWKALSLNGKMLLPAKLIVFGGEALRAVIAEEIFASGSTCRVVNHYGPTETTIGKLLHQVEPGKKYGLNIPIGKPFSNTRTYVLSKSRELCPIGVPGQLFISGEGVARGYFNKPDITKEKFIADPFSEEPGSRMYATGDLVKYLQDGNIDFIGRVDDQVKIRGYRIELGEIESAMNQCEMVQQAVVLAREDSHGNKRLVGYVVPGLLYDSDDLKAYLKEKLPDYMIPGQVVELDTLPLTANGKVDKKALPDPDGTISQAHEYTAPRNDAEKVLAEIWQDLLDIERVGIHDNFFELGGDSIITIQLVSRARRAGYQLQMGDVFTYQTIARLSELFDQRADVNDVTNAEQFLLEGACGLLPVQQWYFEKEPVEVSHFNQTVLLTIDKSLTESLIKRAIEQLTAHHDALRFKYYRIDSIWYQVYEHQSEMSRLATEDFQSVSEDELPGMISAHSDKYQKSLDIEKGDLLRVVLMKTPVTEPYNRLLIAVHHLAVDGVSWRILLEDLELLFNGFKNGGSTDLGKKTSSYRQWYDALVKYGSSEKVHLQKKYWEKVVRNYSAIPVDKNYDPPLRVKDTRVETMRLGMVMTRNLTHDVPRVYHTEINDILMAALAKTVSEYANTDKVTIGLEGHGREDIEAGVDTSRTVGWFTTHFPVLLEVNRDKDYDDLIKNIKEQLHQIPDKGLGFGVLKYLQGEVDWKGTTCWDLVFNYLGQADNVLSSSNWLGGASESAGADRSPEFIVHDKLAVNGMVQGGELVLNWTYSEKHFEKETIVALIQKFTENLEALITHCLDEQKRSGSIFTPADFGLSSEISYRELDVFLNEPFDGKARKESLEGLYRLSGLQQGMLFHGLYDQGGSGYLNHFWCDLVDPDLPVLKKSWNHVLRCHSILRSAFYYDVFNIPVQTVYNKIKLPIQVLDYRDLDGIEQERKIKEFGETDRAAGFDFKTSPLMRITLIRLNDIRYRMLWSSHHILFDGWSRSIMMGEFLKVYDLLLSRKPLPIVDEDRYEDFIRHIERIDKDKEHAYWKNYLSTFTQSTFLPFINPTAERTKGLGIYSSSSFTLDKNTTSEIERFAQRHKITINTVMQGVWAFLLHQYTGSPNVVYGVIVSGRPEDMAGVEHRVGMYINTLPLHVSIPEGKAVVPWLQEIQKNQVASREFQSTPLHEIQKIAGIQGDLFDSLFVFENYPVNKIIQSGQWSLKVENVEIVEQTNYPLNVVVAGAEEIGVDFIFNTELIHKPYIEALKEQFEHILLQLTKDDSVALSEIEFLSASARQKLLKDFNNTETDYPRSKTLIGLFEEQVTRTPDGAAVSFDGKALTYNELNVRCNQLAHYLRQKGIREKSLVPICLDRSIEMIVGIWSILKAGGAYVPIDPGYPDERIQYMLGDTGATIALTTSNYKSRLAFVKGFEIIEIDRELPVISQQPSTNLQSNILPGDLAYIIYTSGSTGQPKGVMNEHAGVVNRLLWAQDYFKLTPEDAVLQKTTFCFDVSVWELLWPLLVGSRLVFAKPEGHRDPAYLKSIIDQENITMLHFVPSMLGAFLAELEVGECKTLMKVLCSGEALKPSQVEQFKVKLPHVELHNLYGPTEAAIDVTYWSLPDQPNEKVTTVPIGKPVANTSIYILDSQHRLIPIGGMGEINIGGVQVARGYLNRPELTREKFVTDPFSVSSARRMYKTGDLGRWLPDGNIDYLGRIDEQVKIRGFRIELGEIEACMAAEPGVKNARVLVSENNEALGKELHAYVEIDREKLPLLSNYLELLHAKRIDQTALNILPNGLPVLGANNNEVKFLYDEIFHDLSYLKHGITLRENSCVVDIGANIGFFTVFLNLLNQNTQVYSIEPIPEVYNYLEANRKLYNIKGKSFQLALLDKEQEVEFVYYPQMTILSGIGADRDKVKNVVRSYVHKSEHEALNEEELDSLLEMKLESRKVNIKAKTLSQIISEEELEQIDLLKIDVENSEHLVLAGLNDLDWRRINNIIIEVHDEEGRLKKTKRLLEDKGFVVHVEKENLLSEDDVLYNIYATRNPQSHDPTGLRENEKLRRNGWELPQELIKKITLSIGRRLPEYMLPTHTVLLAKFPLTPNGKIDKKALPAPGDIGAIIREYQLPQTNTEKILVRVWEDILNREGIGILDDFFSLGGHSLLAMRMCSAIRKQLEIEMVIKAVFLHPTVKELALYLDSQSRGFMLPPITAQAKPHRIPLSYSQERLWFIDRLEGSLHYHLPTVMRFSGTLNIAAVSHALQEIINRHEALRTVIVEEDGTGFQYVKEQNQWQLNLIEGSAYIGNEELLRQYIHQLIRKPFNLATDYKLRADLISVTNSDHLLVVTLHHIAADGWSLSVIVKEIVELYTSFLERRPPKLEPLPIQYADYAIWQRKYLQGEVLEKKLDYWKTRLHGVSTLQLPTDYPRPAMQSIRGARMKFVVEKEIAEKLQSLSHQRGVTLFMTLLAAFKVLLHKYSGQNDICVGTPVANRTQQEVESLIGFFINTIALRTDFSNNPAFGTLLEQVKKATLEAYSHQEVPFEKVVEAVVTERDMSRNPLFQILLTLQNTPEVPELKLTNTRLSIEETEHKTSQLDIICNLTQTSHGLVGSVEYCTDLYTGQTVSRMMRHFKQLLYAIVESPDEKIASLQMMADDEKEEILKTFNNTTAAYAKPRTILELFEQQVLENAGKVSVVFEDQQLTFAELNGRANQLARHLRSKGVHEEALVPICIGRSAEMLIAILGILKAGAAYVPIDPDYPPERIRYILEDTKASIAICSSHTNSGFSDFADLDLVVIDDDWSFIALHSSSNPSFDVKPNHLAYIIYTSGSTGKPKGVMIEHRNLYSYLLNDKTKYIDPVKNTTGSFIHLSYTFDASLTGLFMPILFGKTVVIGSKQSFDVFEDENLQKYAPYDFIKITPAHLDLLLPKMRTDFGGLLTRKLVIGGEALLLSQFNSMVEDGMNVEIINEYGPTEATVGCSIYRFQTLEAGRPVKNEVSIGKPIDNVQMYILSSHLELLPVGVPGEIYIAGAGVARGYINRPDLTSERFLVNPFSNEWGGRMYRTGDLARWSPDGNIEYLGRVDDQVKIRGYRVELGEIESVLQQFEGVRQAVVLAKGNVAGNKKLVAYVVSEDEFDKDSIIQYLKEKLPEYMIPALWVELDRLPLTSNGKVDKNSLPDPEAGEIINTEYAAPRDATEQALVEVWQELLDVERVGIHDNFFDLGGDSIIIIQIVSRARRAGIEFQVSDVFTHQTISRLCDVLKQRTGSSPDAAGEQGWLTGESGLLPIQQWYFESDREDISHFNQSIFLNIDKEITAQELNDSLRELIGHHDALRFAYTRREGVWRQEYSDHKENLYVEDLSHEIEDFDGTLTTKANEYQRSLNIGQGDLIRMVLFDAPPTESKNRLLIVIHHLAVDGISWRILLEDLELLLTASKTGTPASIGNKSASYRQWFEVLTQYSVSNKLLSQKQYWEKIVAKYRPLSTDNNYDGPVKVKNIGHELVTLESSNTQVLLHDVPRVYHTEINDLLLSPLAKTLCDWTRADNIVIGLEGHGREQIAEGLDINRTVGWFTSMYPVLLDLSVAKGPEETIKEVKEQLRRVPGKGLGFGVLKYLKKDQQFAAQKQWDIVFNYFGQLDNVVENGKWLSAAKESRGSGISETHEVEELLSINAMIRNGELVLDWGYSKLHFNKETIATLTNEYKSNLELLIAHCIARGKSGTTYTPSDYGLGAEITNSELDAFLDEPFRNGTRRESIEGMYRLSGLQQGMLFHGLYDNRAGAYIEQLACDLKNPDINAFRKSWEHLLKRHTILRSAFYPDTFNVPVQCVYKDVELPLELLDFSGLSQNEQSAAVEKFEASDIAIKLDFSSVPLMRLTLIRLSGERYRMVWTSHHILFDGWSMPVLMEEFLRTYELLVTGNDIPSFEEDKYEDYIRYIERRDREKEEKFWRNYLKDVTQGTLLPFIRAAVNRTKGVGLYRSLSIRFDPQTTERAERFAQQHRVTVNTLMQGVWSYLLHHYTSSKDVVFGVIVSGRPEDLSHVEQRVGMYINTLPFHSNLKGEQDIVQWLQGIQEYQVASRQYQYTPLHHIQAWKGVKGDLFDSLLVVENYPVSKVIGAGKWKLEVENLQINEQTNYPLSIFVAIADQISVRFSYNTAFLKDEYIRQISRHFENVFLQLFDKTNRKVEEINVLTPADEKQLLLDFNDTKSAYPLNHNIITLFEEQAAKTPLNTAVVFGNDTLSYRELNENSNKIAYYLRSKGVSNGTLVPICMERNPLMIASLLGILKAGGAYVPIDPEYPQERISYMLEDTGAPVVLTSLTSKTKLQSKKPIEILEADGNWPQINKYPGSNIHVKISPEQLAYVIYTSGSTGKPKGVMIEHRNAYSFLCWSREEFASSRFDIVYASTSICFDLSLFEIFYPLTVGKPIRILENGLHIGDHLPADRFVLTNSVPVVIENLLNEGIDLSNISVMNMAGEPIPISVLERLDTDKIETRNLYGPTEDTTYSTVFRLKNNLPVLIGKPISNTSIYIVNHEMKPVAVGVAGEICISGDGLAKGYLNQPELTSEKFVTNPFSPRERLYRTGDLGRWLPDGNIEYLGRIDDQVKIRGYRIELGEIEAALQQNDLVQQAVVLARADQQGQKRLVAYITPHTGFDKQSVIDYLRHKLPEFMIPALWVELEAMPLTPNGKVDKRALPNPDVSELLATEYIAPRTDLEQQLVLIWQNILNLERIGVRDNFFELGGHSLLVIRLLSATRKELKVDVAINTFFELATIEGVAHYIKVNQENFKAKIEDYDTIKL